MNFLKAFSAEKTGGKPREIVEAVNAGRSSAVFYAVENVRYHLASCLKGFALYVVNDRVAARKAARTLSAYLGSEVPVIAEREDVLINSRAVSGYSLGERIRALYLTANGGCKAAVVSADGLLQLYPSKKSFCGRVKTVCVNGTDDVQELTEFLARAGYLRKDAADERGTFALKGDTLYIFGFDGENPVRIEFFGDTVESIKRYDGENYKVTKAEENYCILPASDILIEKEDVRNIVKRVSEAAKGAKLELSEKLKELCGRFLLNECDPSLSFLLPFMRGSLATVFDYLPEGAAVVLDDVRSLDDKLKLLRNSHSVRAAGFAESGEALKEHDAALFGLKEIYSAMNARAVLGFLQITSQNNVFVPKEVFSVRCKAISPYYNNPEQLAVDVKANIAVGNRVFIFCDPLTLKATEKLLIDNYIGSCLIDDISAACEVNLIRGDIPSGFMYPDEKLVIIGQDDLVKRREAKRKAKKRGDFVLPEKGDYVVHEKHGIGLSEGMMSVETRDGYKDFYVVAYKGGDRLYLPASQLDTLEKYSGADNPAIHKLGGAEFEKVKAKAKESIKKMTIDLLKLYEKRLTLKGFAYPRDTVWQKEMEDSFEFEETADQLAAIEDIKRDMESGRIMDRLLCGDVGYGKTEVAIRAIFKTVIEGKQAAFLSPTTILAQQHFNTVCARLNNYKLNIVLLSRFVSPKQIKENLIKIKSGEANVIVGTHRLLSADVEFNDLGLLVLDEEQRFGVEHKEKIKSLRSNINVLSLTATPIPRTLHMSLSGIRDISLLETPPENRLPVETYVTEYSDGLLIDAVNKELARGGQVFILYNKVATIEAFYRKVRSLLGTASVIFAHGQMDDSTLEDRIKQFYDREASVMICTTIIENGIDLPLANTLIVIDSDLLGLSQLYQLRGRVGRGNVLAYAYFTVSEGKVLTENAAKRLEALMEFTELGSGFGIAMRDLDIRGAGNVLGREQSGQLDKVGYDMYCRLIRECVDEAAGKHTGVKRDIEMIADGDASLPNDYISDSRHRIKFYKRISAMGSMAEAKEYSAELREIYGKIPKSVSMLIALSIIKNAAQKLGVKKAVISNNGSGLHFYDDSCLQNEKLIYALSVMSGRAVLSPSDPPSVVFKNASLSREEKAADMLKFLCEATKED